MRTPTPSQAQLLRTLAQGHALVCGTRQRERSCVRWGWLAPLDPQRPSMMLRITPDGLRALAAAQECNGLPELSGDWSRDGDREAGG